MEQKHGPHVVILPFPLPGHVKPILNLALLLYHKGFQITFINSQHNHHRLRNICDITSFCNRSPGFELEAISDGLPVEHPRTGPNILKLFYNTKTIMKPLFRELMIDLMNSNRRSPPICIIADTIMSFAVDVGRDLCVPVFGCATSSPGGVWAVMHTSKLIESGEIPFQEEDMDQPITSISRMENLLRRRDLPSTCRLGLDHPMVQFYIAETKTMCEFSGLICNTFEELDARIISALKSIYSKVYPIGPFHALFKSHIDDPSSFLSSHNAAWREEDRSCIIWLDRQKLKSVIYVSFGTFAGLSRTQFLEFLYGLVNSGKPFLFVVRPDLVEGITHFLSTNSMSNSIMELCINHISKAKMDMVKIPKELEEGLKERGCLVGWAPQEEVLAHPAIGGFLTHSGWNSTLESIYEGVPMICWPLVADQQVTSRCVSHLWKIGLDMKDTCDRKIIEKMVRDLMEEKREDFVKSMSKISTTARDSVKLGGSSCESFEMLINDLQAICSVNS